MQSIGTQQPKTARRNRVAATNRYAVRIAGNRKEVESALRLRNEVFNVEMNGKSSEDGLEHDSFDSNCDHLIVTDNLSGRAVGTYRLNSVESASNSGAFYSSAEFTIETLPDEILEQSVEIGRACIARDHRSTTVLFHLWKGLANYLRQNNKRYFFGCCSIFTTDYAAAAATYEKLDRDGFVDANLRVGPRNAASDADSGAVAVELPPLMEMYLRIGAKVCGPPAIDRAFGTIDFFVIFDIETIDAKYHRMFFS